MSKKLSDHQLQKQLDALTQANNAARKARDKIMDHCQEIFGCEPADVDFDEFIDACDNGCGASEGMKVQDFNSGMKRLTAQ